MDRELERLQHENENLRNVLEEVFHACMQLRFGDEFRDLGNRIANYFPEWEFAQCMKKVVLGLRQPKPIVKRSMPFKSPGHGFIVGFESHHISVTPFKEGDPAEHMFSIPPGIWNFAGTSFKDLICKGIDRTGEPKTFDFGGEKKSDQPNGQNP